MHIKNQLVCLGDMFDRQIRQVILTGYVGGLISFNGNARNHYHFIK